MFWERVLAFVVCLLTAESGFSTARPVFHNFVKHNLLLEKASEPADLILYSIKQDHSELQTIVIDQYSEFFSKSETLTYKDPTIPPEAFQFYSEYSSIMIQSVAFYITPFGKLTGHETRPLEDRPVMVIKKNAPKHVIFHELGHFFLDLELRNGNLELPSDEDLIEIAEGVGEEVFVDLTLLNYADDLQFNEDDFCARHKYMAQNLQVMNFKLKEVLKRKPDLSQTDQTFLSILYDVYSEANALKLKHHTQCFFWKPKK